MSAQTLKLCVVSVALGIALSGCGYKPLKAPCSPDEGQSHAYASPTSRSSSLQTAPIPSAFESLDPCGPLKPI